MSEPGHDEDEIQLPRSQTGAQPQHLIVTLFGDYWFGNTAHLPSSGLVALANDFGISATSARAALSRLARRGLLTSSKIGRRTFYGPTPRCVRVLEDGRQRIFSFGRDGLASWDGTWLVVVFSVPEEQRDVRHALRTRLRWLGFAPLYDGVWASPRGQADEVQAVLAECGVEQATVLRSTVITPELGSSSHPLAAWNLDQLATAYHDFIAEFTPLRTRVRRGRINASEALVERTAIMDTWRAFPNLDPELPPEVLPADWPRTAAYDLWAEVYDALTPLAALRFKQLLAEYAPELAELAHYDTTQTALTAIDAARLERRVSG
ncbi:PaaX family transcriptional regulator C-terminal domain-containing protein [uncultured Jatrophihabitans sp.]|uniref:PaaX family transcriptional regulator n=1 Tax=uncultured Jatrophihabitans sp. TaxID=1610747 RepID=UPI0035CB8FA2